MSSNVFLVTKIYIYREDVPFPIDNKGAGIFPIFYVLQIMIEYCHVRLHVDRETVYF